jgi:radical SAM protein with 4Fe4S-binding SPASM domain
MIFNRENSTLGIMDDLQIAIHTYDGCSRGCAGCLVDTHFKNQRFSNILTLEQMKIIHERVLEYYDWCQHYLNHKENGYFGKNGQQIKHFSYTFRFGNHSELPLETLLEISSTLNAPYKVFSTGPTEDISKFYELTKEINNPQKSRFFLEIIYDPIHDKAEDIKNMILEMRKHDILGYPEVLITKRLLDKFSPQDFFEQCILPLGHIETQMQFGRYTPSKTRNFNMKQIVHVDDEIEWLTQVAKLIAEHNLNIHPIPIAEYAVTFLDEYQEYKLQTEKGIILENELDSLEEPFNIQNVKDKTRDIFLSSLYIDHHLDLYIWSESMGQHVLDNNFGFPKLGNIRESSIQDLVSSSTSMLEKMLQQNIIHLLKHKKCSSCRYKSFCSSHAIPFFRKFQEDDGKHCYGYLPVIREFQKNQVFLQNMIDGFKKLEF